MPTNNQPEYGDLVPGITPALMNFLHNRFRLGKTSIHGPLHWQRVWENGQRLALLNGANLMVVALFAFTHDVARLDEGADWQHGPRAAHLIQEEIQGNFINLPEDEINLLLLAVHTHTYGHCNASLTVQTCWDADRLDLGRTGIRPDPHRLCTDHARQPEIMQWAYQRSLSHSFQEKDFD